MQTKEDQIIERTQEYLNNITQSILRGAASWRNEYTQKSEDEIEADVKKKIEEKIEDLILISLNLEKHTTTKGNTTYRYDRWNKASPWDAVINPIKKVVEKHINKWLKAFKFEDHPDYNKIKKASEARFFESFQYVFEREASTRATNLAKSLAAEHFEKIEELILSAVKGHLPNMQAIKEMQDEDSLL